MPPLASIPLLEKQSSTTQAKSASEQMAELIKRVDELSARGQQYRNNNRRVRGKFSHRSYYGRNVAGSAFLLATSRQPRDYKHRRTLATAE